jgi:HPt (histidine-containing phosphotransfer) domain-containing protein
LKRPAGPELIAGYLNEAQAMVSALQSAVTQGDPQAMWQAAHSLRGSSSYVGAKKVAALSFELEQQGRQGMIHDAAATVVQLVEEFEYIRQVLGDLKRET